MTIGVFNPFFRNTVLYAVKFRIMKKYIGQKIELKEMPQLRFGNPNVKVGNEYLIIDVEGSNFWLIDEDGNRTTFGSCRFGV